MALREAASLQRQGRPKQAIAAYRRVLARAPNIPEAHHNLGLAYQILGDLSQAETSFRQALGLKAGYARAHHSLANCLARQGRPTEALGEAVKAARLAPNERGYLRDLAALLPFGRLSTDGEQARVLLERCFRDDGIEHQWLVASTLSVLRADPAITAALHHADQEQTIADETLLACANEPLLALLLPRAIIADEAFERLLTALRRRLLHRHLSPVSNSGDESQLVNFAAALACQCALVDYAYAESREESEAVEDLANRLAGWPEDALLPWPDLVHLALYRPLSVSDASVHRMTEAHRENETLQLFQERLHRAPQREAQILPAIPVLAMHGNQVSSNVQRQYEENPYPRWLTTRERPSRPLAAVISSLFPHAAPMPDPNESISILVAGCGSGKHAVDVATRFANASVLAIDLSRRALAYGQRQAERRALANLKFAQADILALDRLERRFDLVESVGVLHHLADPLLGWRILAGLLKPGGFMRIGLYSRQGREHIEAARSFVASAGFSATHEHIPTARQALLDLPPDHPARQVTRELDFFSLTGCRDLIFNVQEQTFTLTSIDAALTRLGLKFLGFELHDPAVPAAYTKRFPDDSTMTDLGNWDRFEQEQPHLFGRMYQFWCRAD